MKIISNEIITENGVQFKVIKYDKKLKTGEHFQRKERIITKEEVKDIKTLNLNEKYSDLINQNTTLDNDTEVDRLRAEYAIKLAELEGE